MESPHHSLQSTFMDVAYLKMSILKRKEKREKKKISFSFVLFGASKYSIIVYVHKGLDSIVVVVSKDNRKQKILHTKNRRKSIFK